MPRYLVSIEGDLETDMNKEDLEKDLRIKVADLKIDLLTIEIEEFAEE